MILMIVIPMIRLKILITMIDNVRKKYIYDMYITNQIEDTGYEDATINKNEIAMA